MKFTSGCSLLSGEGSHFHIPTSLPLEALLWDCFRKMQTNDTAQLSVPPALMRSTTWAVLVDHTWPQIPSASSLWPLRFLLLHPFDPQGAVHCPARMGSCRWVGVKMECGATKHRAQHTDVRCGRALCKQICCSAAGTVQITVLLCSTGLL